ncbi:hypothetical protein B296_00036192 [Ensete ventricosum]|uniref:Uncharacterized protein n=1 Tax=Ensete ventricosum TaxID=4639 RepID=A0A426XC57_ENSVE|nr:hypothetical protein B296_00036192 [Ensete ventricosum]
MRWSAPSLRASLLHSIPGRPCLPSFSESGRQQTISSARSWPPPAAIAENNRAGAAATRKEQWDRLLVMRTMSVMVRVSNLAVVFRHRVVSWKDGGHVLCCPVSQQLLKRWPAIESRRFRGLVYLHILKNKSMKPTRRKKKKKKKKKQGKQSLLWLCYVLVRESSHGDLRVSPPRQSTASTKHRCSSSVHRMRGASDLWYCLTLRPKNLMPRSLLLLPEVC